MGKFIETKVLEKDYKRKQLKKFTRNKSHIDNFKNQL